MSTHLPYYCGLYVDSVIQAICTTHSCDLQVEQDLKFARFLAGLHGNKARKEVGELMNAVVETGAALPLIEDKLVTLMEAAQVRSTSRLCFTFLLPFTLVDPLGQTQRYSVKLTMLSLPQLAGLGR